jgi:hypothetical protein
MQPHSFQSKGESRKIPAFICLVGDCSVLYIKGWGFGTLEFDKTATHLPSNTAKKSIAIAIRGSD